MKKEKRVKSVSNDQHSINYETGLEQEKAEAQKLKNESNKKSISISSLNNFKGWGRIG